MQVPADHGLSVIGAREGHIGSPFLFVRIAEWWLDARGQVDLGIGTPKQTVTNESSLTGNS